MGRTKLGSVSATVTILTMTLGLGVACKAQDQTQEPSREVTTPAPDQQRQKADGERHGLPIETFAVASAPSGASDLLQVAVPQASRNATANLPWRRTQAGW